MAEFEGFAPGKSTKDCTDGLAWGTKSTLYSYIFKGNSAESDYPADACSPYYHGNAQIDNLKVNTEIMVMVILILLELLLQQEQVLL